MPTGGRCTISSACVSDGRPEREQTLRQQIRNAVLGQGRQRTLDPRAMSPLRQPLGRRIDRRHRLRQRFAEILGATIFGMNDLESQRTAPHIAMTAQFRATSQALLLRSGEIEESERQDPGAITEAHQQAAPPTKHHFRQQHLALHHRCHAGLQGTDPQHLGPILVAQRQYE